MDRASHEGTGHRRRSGAFDHRVVWTATLRRAGKSGRRQAGSDCWPETCAPDGARWAFHRLRPSAATVPRSALPCAAKPLPPPSNRTGAKPQTVVPTISATGVIEGTCPPLVQDRLGIAGARWGLDSAEAVLKLRALRTNGDFDRHWRFHLAQAPYLP